MEREWPAEWARKNYKNSTTKMKAFKLNRRKIEREKSVEATNELISIAKNPRYASFRILFENRGFYSSQMKQEETKYCDKCNLLRSLPKNKKKIYFSWFCHPQNHSIIFQMVMASASAMKWKMHKLRWKHSTDLRVFLPQSSISLHLGRQAFHVTCHWYRTTNSI